ncbi:MAG: ABC transporter permease [Chloroflexi bacterium]|nr:ABC transporter permease [Chloroflexota bacterium]MBK7179951.1 ABC transporter permease [Chloroflexota bacterium]MBK7916892.1 ABC transporter permease [Chloroflexota bacterium]MBP6803819.1 ABC transporter permease [Chloroflexota bacterium]MBP7592422.1 ABC transporter permease [Chloroflexota bacterium]
MASISTTPREQSVWQRITASLRKIAPIYIVLILLLIGIGTQNPTFLEPAGFLNLLRRAAPLMVLTAGQLFVIVTGGFDLSVGSIMSLTVIGAALLINNDPVNTWWVILVLLGIGVVVGLLNGFIVSYLNVPSLIATLGMLLTLRGAGLYWTGGAPRGYLTDNFRMFGRGWIEPFPFIERFPYAVLVLIIVSGVVIFLFTQTNLGRQLLAIGDNPRAARLAGIPVEKMRIVAFVLSAVTAVIAGILQGGFGGVNPEAGDGYELQAISAAVLGGAVLGGGRGSMPAAIAGALALEALFTLLNLLGLPKPLRDAVQGLIIIGAVAYGAYRSRRIR